MIISVLNQKGGAGKTTLATNLAAGIAKRGASVVIADTDPQGSARDWAAAGEGKGVAVVGLDRANGVSAGVTALSKSHDVVVIDGAPSVDALAAEAIKNSDVVLIPVQPSPYDIWAAATIVEMIKARQSLTGKPFAAFLISRAIPNTILERETAEALAEHGLLVWTGTTQRQAYPKAAASGSSIYDTTDATAIAEIEAILNLIENSDTQLIS